MSMQTGAVLNIYCNIECSVSTANIFMLNGQHFMTAVLSCYSNEGGSIF